MVSSSALLASYLQNLSFYPVSEAGRAMAPRGLGTMAAMFIASRLGGRYVDQRKLMAFGLLVLGGTMYSMTTWTPDLSESAMVTTLLIQGFAMGFIFNPMTVVAFATLPAQYRSDAAALQNLARNTGAAIGLSIAAFNLTRGAQISHADMAAGITPFNHVLQGHGALSRLIDPATQHGAGLLEAMIGRQAQIIAYTNDYWLMTFMVVPPLLLLLIMRKPARPPSIGKA
jgi:DHA2 family multidrug resistance protein